MHVCMYASIYLSICLSVYLSIDLSIDRSIYLSDMMCLYVCIEMHPHTQIQPDYPIGGWTAWGYDLGPSTMIPSNDSCLWSHSQNLGQYCWRVRCVIQNIKNKHRSPWRKNNHHRIHGCYWMPCFQPDVVFFHKRQDHKTATHQPTEASSKNERDDQHVEFLLECGNTTSRLNLFKLLQAGLPTHQLSPEKLIASPTFTQSFAGPH